MRTMTPKPHNASSTSAPFQLERACTLTLFSTHPQRAVPAGGKVRKARSSHSCHETSDLQPSQYPHPAPAASGASGASGAKPSARLTVSACGLKRNDFTRHTRNFSHRTFGAGESAACPGQGCSTGAAQVTDGWGSGPHARFTLDPFRREANERTGALAAQCEAHECSTHGAPQTKRQCLAGLKNRSTPGHPSEPRCGIEPGGRAASADASEYVELGRSISTRP